MNANGTKFRKL